MSVYCLELEGAIYFKLCFTDAPFLVYKFNKENDCENVWCLDFELYKGKKYSSLLKDVVVNSEQKKDQIDILVSDLRSMIKTANDAIVVVPLIKDYLDVSVRNDEQLVKLAAVVQRIISSQSQGDDGNMGMLLSEDERKQLMGEVDKITKEINTPIEINSKK